MSREKEHDTGTTSYLALSWRAFKLLLDDYHWVTKAASLLLIFSCLLGVFVVSFGAGVLDTLVGWVSWKRIEDVLISESFRTLLTLLIALLVGVSIKRRQLEGLLDGDDHYNIGRALAFGYFKNFLVGALLIAKRNNTVLQVFRPQSVGELRRFEEEVWPRIDSSVHAKPREIDSSLTANKKPLARRIIIVQSIQSGRQGELWLDFPTTLFTIGDYYQSWNRWLARERKAMVSSANLNKFEGRQIAEFFRHLEILMRDGIGLQAVDDYQLSASELAALFDKQLVLLSLDDLEKLLEVG